MLSWSSRSRGRLNLLRLTLFIHLRCVILSLNKSSLVPIWNVMCEWSIVTKVYLNVRCVILNYWICYKHIILLLFITHRKSILLSTHVISVRWHLKDTTRCLTIRVKNVVRIVILIWLLEWIREDILVLVVLFWQGHRC